MNCIGRIGHWQSEWPEPPTTWEDMLRWKIYAQFWQGGKHSPPGIWIERWLKRASFEDLPERIRDWLIEVTSIKNGQAHTQSLS